MDYSDKIIKVLSVLHISCEPVKYGDAASVCSYRNARVPLGTLIVTMSTRVWVSCH